jgi:hypothetical protein
LLVELVRFFFRPHPPCLPCRGSLPFFSIHARAREKWEKAVYEAFDRFQANEDCEKPLDKSDCPLCYQGVLGMRGGGGGSDRVGPASRCRTHPGVACVIDSSPLAASPRF